ncbi:DUF551 domain-containing protein [Escherichia coli]
MSTKTWQLRCQFTWMQGGRCAFQLSNGDIFIATHWMPLPAAPQQEVE